MRLHVKDFRFQGQRSFKVCHNVKNRNVLSGLACSVVMTIDYILYVKKCTLSLHVSSR